MATCAAMLEHEWLANNSGTHDYVAGTVAGVMAVPVVGNVTGIRIRGNVAATFNLNGGDTKNVLKNEIWVENPVPGTLIDPTLNVLTGTVHYNIEFLI